MTALLPRRFAADDRSARAELAATGGVVLTGLGGGPDSLAVAAALLFGARLRELFPVRTRRSADDGPVALHNDSFDVVVDVAGVPVRRRHPDEDHVLLTVETRPEDGGASFAADAHAVTDAFPPDLRAFLHESDVDLFGRWAGIRGLPSVPRVGRHVEFTRAGRRITRRGEGATALHRDPDTGRVRDMLARLAEEADRVQAALPRFPVAVGEVLVLDNYRCWHGRDAHRGERVVHIQTLRTTDA